MTDELLVYLLRWCFTLVVIITFKKICLTQIVSEWSQMESKNHRHESYWLKTFFTNRAALVFHHQQFKGFRCRHLSAFYFVLHGLLFSFYCMWHCGQRHWSVSSLKVALQHYTCMLFALFMKAELECQYGDVFRWYCCCCCYTRWFHDCFCGSTCCRLIAYQLRRLTSALQLQL